MGDGDADCGGEGEGLVGLGEGEVELVGELGGGHGGLLLRKFAFAGGECLFMGRTPLPRLKTQEALIPDSGIKASNSLLNGQLWRCPCRSFNSRW